MDEEDDRREINGVKYVLFSKLPFTFMILLLFICITSLAGCSNKEVNKVNDGKEVQEESTDVIADHQQEQKEHTDETTEVDEDIVKEDILLDGQVTVEGDGIRIEGKSNLAEGTVVQANLLYNPFNTYRSTTKPSTNEKVEVDQDGNFNMELSFSKFSNHDFLAYYRGREIEVEMEVLMTESKQPDEVKTLYGEHGENFRGPFTYTYDRREEVYHKIATSVYVIIGDEQKVYPFAQPNRLPEPDDYGSPHIWIKLDDITFDHKYFYIHGQSNLIEGTALIGGYYADRRKRAQDGHENRTYVEPDGTFLLRVGYRSFMEDGFIWIRSWGDLSHPTYNALLRDAYGEEFENIEGEYVINNEVEDRKEIEIILNPPTPELAVPEGMDLTGEDEELKLQVPDDVLFNFDNSELLTDAKKTLDEVIELLEPLDKDTVIQINGHTDNQGEADYNMKLSEERARAVLAYLEKNGDISHLAITTKGYGKTKPIASNEDPEGQQRNRRVEIVMNAKDE